MSCAGEVSTKIAECGLCRLCGRSIREQFIKVPHGDYHVNCFRCKAGMIFAPRAG